MATQQVVVVAKRSEVKKGRAAPTLFSLVYNSGNSGGNHKRIHTHTIHKPEARRGDAVSGGGGEAAAAVRSLKKERLNVGRLL